MSLVAAKLEPKIALKASYAFTFNVEDALKDKMIDDKYSGQKDLESKISGFANRFAQFGVFREAIKTNKTNQYRETIELCRATKSLDVPLSKIL